jgi:hypothetical protein
MWSQIPPIIGRHPAATALRKDDRRYADLVAEMPTSVAGMPLPFLIADLTVPAKSHPPRRGGDDHGNSDYDGNSVPK